MAERIVAVNEAIFDGHGLDVVLDELAALGVGHVEPSFTQGYTEERGRDFFTEANGARIGKRIAASGLGCIAVSSHMDLGEPDAAEVFAERIAFAAGLGARFIISNTTIRTKRDAFLANMATLARNAEAAGVVIALENPGHGEGALIDGGRSAGGNPVRRGQPVRPLQLRHRQRPQLFPRHRRPVRGPGRRPSGGGRIFTSRTSRPTARTGGLCRSAPEMSATARSSRPLPPRRPACPSRWKCRCA